MRHKIKVFFLRKALNLTKNRLPRSRLATHKNTNIEKDLFKVWIKWNDEKDHTFGVYTVKQNGIEGVIIGKDDVLSPCAIPYQWLGNKTFKAKHYLGSQFFTYFSPVKLLIWEYLRFPRLKILKNLLAQFLYNAKTPIRTDRVEILKKLVELRLELDTDDSISMERILENDYGSEIYEIISKLYGDRIFNHRRYEHISAHLALLLESLVVTNDVIRGGQESHYRATGKALSTIAQYEQENRRHKEQMRHSSKIFWLTVVLALVGILQAYVAWRTLK